MYLFYDIISHYNYITFLYENVVMALALNILIIQTIRNGSKLAGVIYLALVVLAAYAKQNYIILGYCVNPVLSFWIMRISFQIVAFIILFQKDIYRLFRFIFRLKSVF